MSLYYLVQNTSKYTFGINLIIQILLDLKILLQKYCIKILSDS